MGSEQLWDRLIDSLNAWTSATEVAPGRIEVLLPEPGAERRVVIVMTRDEWDDMATVMWGNVDDAIAHVKDTLSQLRPDELFAVYEQYRLEPSSGATLPADADMARMNDLLRQHPEGFGRWTTSPRPPGDDANATVHGDD